MIPARGQDGPERYVEELATVSRASVIDGGTGGWTLLLPGSGIGILYAAHFPDGIHLRGEVPPGGASEPGAYRGLIAAGADMDAHPIGHLHDLFCMGSADLLPGSTTAAWLYGCVCGR